MGRMKIGYARVSTDDQTLDLQLDALAQAGCALVYQEHASGKNAGRQELEACLKALRAGDCLVVWRLDRLGRNLGDLVGIVNGLEARSVGFESLMESIETTSPSGKLVFHLFAALAEFERNVTRERTLAGLRSARARGRAGGRPKKLPRQEDLNMLRALVREGNTPVKDIAARFGISRATVYRLAPANGKT
jgi:DNA invertase Pin-like site-specific DNA recombinase